MTTAPTLVITEVARRTTQGNIESLQFKTGVNIIVGEPNTGKTKWVQTIDYMLGDSGTDPYSIADDDALAEKYEAASLRFNISGKEFYAERRWRETGAKGKIFVNDESLSPKEFQQLLMQLLELPQLSAPSGNPFSGRTWPELSFRTLLRHFYRQQGLWSQLVDKQPEDTFRHSVLLFLGLAEHLYTEDYERRVEITTEIQKLELRRDQFADTLNDIARDFLDEESLSLAVTENSLSIAAEQLKNEYDAALADREDLLSGAIAAHLDDEPRSQIMKLTDKRAQTVARLEAAREEQRLVTTRFAELTSYTKALNDEVDRFRRAQSASSILSDLRITHCPACDQAVTGTNAHSSSCFLCHQPLDAPDLPDALAQRRIEFEHQRLAAEQDEANELFKSTSDELSIISNRIQSLQGAVAEIDRDLAPARQRLSALIQDSISSIDNKLGSIAERLKQLRRLSAIFSEKQQLDQRIEELRVELEPILERYNEAARSLNYSGRAAWLEDGMNDYLTALNSEAPNTWRHKAVRLSLSRSNVTFRVGDRRWDYSLGGTASLYYLMAYHYGLMSLAAHKGARFPGFTMLDFPAEFAGTKIGDAEDFVVQPFIDLLSRDEFEGCQLILTGASFNGLTGINRIHLDRPYLT